MGAISGPANLDSVKLNCRRILNGKFRTLPITIEPMFEKKLDPEDYYMSPEGFMVFTEKYHLKRGHCCQSGCKHCPYGFNKKTGKFDRK